LEEKSFELIVVQAMEPAVFVSYNFEQLENWQNYYNTGKVDEQHQGYGA